MLCHHHQNGKAWPRQIPPAPHCDEGRSSSSWQFQSISKPLLHPKDNDPMKRPTITGPQLNLIPHNSTHPDDGEGLFTVQINNRAAFRIQWHIPRDGWLPVGIADFQEVSNLNNKYRQSAE